MKYQCPDCKTVIESSQKLEFCICGGKYESAEEKADRMFNEIFTELWDLRIKK